MYKWCFWIFIFFVRCNYHITFVINFFFLRSMDILGFLTSVFLELFHGIKGILVFLSLKKNMVGVCGTSWLLLIAFCGIIWSIALSSIRWSSTCWLAWHKGALAKKILLPPFFFILHLIRYAGLAKWPSII